MKYEKLDPPLRGALEEMGDEAAQSLTVFVHLDHEPDMNEQHELEKRGVRVEGKPKTIITDSLTPGEIKALTDMPVVQRIRLSQKMRLLSPD